MERIKEDKLCNWFTLCPEQSMKFATYYEDEQMKTM